jgi:hypothetical protein
MVAECRNQTIKCIAAQEIAHIAQRAHLPGACKQIDQHSTGQQRHPTDIGDDESLYRSATRGLPCVIETDQQEGGDRGQFPEHEQGQQTIGQNQPQHGAHEGQQEAEETTLMLVSGEIGPRIDQDQRADAGNGQRKDKAEPIDEEAQIEPISGHPFERRGNRAALDDRFGQSKQIEKDRRRDDCQYPAGKAPRKTVHDWRQCSRQKWQNGNRGDGNIYGDFQPGESLAVL